MKVFVENRKKRKDTILKKYPEAVIIDVTSKAKDEYQQLSPFYPHGKIPIPFSEGQTAQSVEGIWQGLKVFEKEDVFWPAFENRTMKNIKRTVRKNGLPKGHRRGLKGEEVLGYIEARIEIYLPAYEWVLKNKCSELLKSLTNLATGRTLILLDYETNTDIFNEKKPLSHAGLVKAYIEGKYPSTKELKNDLLKQKEKAKKYKTSLSSPTAWYALLKLKGFGEKALLALYQGMKKHDLELPEVFRLSETDFLNYFPEIGQGKLHRAKYSAFLEIDYAALTEEVEALEEEGIHIVGLKDERYPAALKKQLKSACPPVLFMHGPLELLEKTAVSIVGARNASEEVLQRTRELAQALHAAGYNVVSGYAKGVDSAAHYGALENEGNTTAILAEGIKKVSRKREFSSLENWQENTLFISQFEPEAKWSARNAMTRNALVTGLAQAVIVMCAGPERDAKGRMSGTFQGAAKALEKGIPVFVLAPELAEGAEGNSTLLKRGAKLYGGNPKNLISALSLPEEEKGQQDIFATKQQPTRKSASLEELLPKLTLAQKNEVAKLILAHFPELA